MRTSGLILFALTLLLSDLGFSSPPWPCCLKKSVGHVSYTLHSQGTTMTDCEGDCIYYRDDDPTSRYCFKPGNLTSTCNAGSSDAVSADQIMHTTTETVIVKVRDVQLDDGQRCKCYFKFVDCKCHFNFVHCKCQLKFVDCDDQCSGTASDVELEAQHEGELYIFKVSFDVVGGKGKITAFMVHCHDNNQVTDWPCPLNNIGLFGPRRLFPNVTSWELCGLKCRQDPPCNYWSYQTDVREGYCPIGNREDCWLHSFYTGTSHHLPGRISGNADCITNGDGTTA